MSPIDVTIHQIKHCSTNDSHEKKKTIREDLVLDSAPLSSLVADREDGGWPSTTTPSTCERQHYYNEAIPSEVPRLPQDLPIIDLLDDVTDQIEFKTEPLSPKMDALSCLLSDETNITKDCPTMNNTYDCQSDVRLPDKADDMRQRVGTYCTFCQKSFSRAWSLQRHLADTHFYVPQSLTCDQCGRSYKSRNSLISHKSQYHAKKERKDHDTNYMHEVTY